MKQIKRIDETTHDLLDRLREINFEYNLKDKDFQDMFNMIFKIRAYNDSLKDEIELKELRGE